MSGARPTISVIIRTKAASDRKALLRRAIASVFRQEGVDVSCLVVVNNNAYDSDLVRSLNDDKRLECIFLPYADKPGATSAGRAYVRTEFFSYLDDDDELLPDCLFLRLQYLREHPDVDCVATNGDYVDGDATRPVFRDMERISEDFTGALLKGRNWLASCGGTFRSGTVTESYFEELPPHCEWTVVAFRIATRLKVAFIDLPTYRVHSTPSSQSKTSTYVEALPEVAQDMLRWNAEPRLIPAILKKETRAYRQACSYHRVNGNFSRAWHYYRKAVSSAFGIVNLPYGLLLLSRTRLHAPEIVGRFTPKVFRGAPIPTNRIDALSLPLFLLLCLAVIVDERKHV